MPPRGRPPPAPHRAPPGSARRGGRQRLEGDEVRAKARRWPRPHRGFRARTASAAAWCAALLDGRDAGSRPTSPPCARGCQLLHRRANNIGRRLDQLLLDQLLDELVAEALDVQRTAAGEMPERLLALRAAGKAAGAAGDGLPFRLHHRRAADRAAAAASPACVPRPASMTTRTTSGITSPARRTTTVSPTRTSLRCTSSMLCSVTLLTVTPPTNTGSQPRDRRQAPVRPTWNSMP